MAARGPTQKQAAVGVAVALGVGLAVSPLGRLTGTSAVAFAMNTDTAVVFCAAAAALCAAATARARIGRVRLAWTSLSIGLVCFGVGAEIWHYYTIAGMAPFLSGADAACLVLPLALCGALLLLTPALSRISRTLLMLQNQRLLTTVAGRALRDPVTGSGNRFLSGVLAGDLGRGVRWDTETVGCPIPPSYRPV